MKFKWTFLILSILITANFMLSKNLKAKFNQRHLSFNVSFGVDGGGFASSGEIVSNGIIIVEIDTKQAGYTITDFALRKPNSPTIVGMGSVTDADFSITWTFFNSAPADMAVGAFLSTSGERDLYWGFSAAGAATTSSKTIQAAAYFGDLLGETIDIDDWLDTHKTEIPVAFVRWEDSFNKYGWGSVNRAGYIKVIHQYEYSVHFEDSWDTGAVGWDNRSGDTIDGNIDGIFGRDDCLRLTMNAISEPHYSEKLISFLANINYRWSVEVYIPSTNSNIDGWGIGSGVGNFNFFMPAVLDSWVTYTGITGTHRVGPISTYIRLYQTDGMTTLFLDAGGDDVIYFRNFRFII